MNSREKFLSVMRMEGGSYNRCPDTQSGVWILGGDHPAMVWPGT